MRTARSTRQLALGAAVLSAFALLVSLTGVTAAGAVHAVARALSADKVDGISASRTPKPGRLLPLGRDGKFPAAVLPGGGPRGGRGPMGPQGPQGQPGATDVRVATAPARELPRTATQEAELVRLDNVPAGRWLFVWSLTAVYLTDNITTVTCVLYDGTQQLAVATGGLGGVAGATHALPLTSMAAVERSASFGVELRCSDNDQIPGGATAVSVADQRLVAIRADSLVVTGG